MRGQGFFYEEMYCRNNTLMHLNHFQRDGLMWQCPSTICGCNPGRGSRQRESVRSGSFFAHWCLSLDLVLQALWGLLHKFSQASIVSFTKSTKVTIQFLTCNFYLLLEGDLHLSNMQVGMYNYMVLYILIVYNIFYRWF